MACCFELEGRSHCDERTVSQVVGCAGRETGDLWESVFEAVGRG